MPDENIPLDEGSQKQSADAGDQAVDVQADGAAGGGAPDQSAPGGSGEPTREANSVESIDDEVEKQMLAQLAEDSGGGTPVDDIVERQMLAQMEGAGGHATEVKKADFQQLTGSSSTSTQNLNLLLDVSLPISIELGRTEMTVQEILNLGPGSVVELNKLAGEPVDLMVNNKIVAKGEVVVIDENFGLRVTSLVSPEDRLKSLGE